MIKVKYKLSYLFLALLFLLFIYPFTEGRVLAGKLLTIYFSLVLIAGAYVASDHKRVNLIISLILGIPTVILIWAEEMFRNDLLDILTMVFVALFCFFTVYCIMQRLMSTKKVTIDALLGAAGAYLLIGISWGMLCALLEILNPGSFTVAVPMGADALEKWSTFNYYSFTTLTTLGYGDITPVSTRAQSFALLEAATGVLFIALLISRLVGMYLYQLNRENENI